MPRPPLQFGPFQLGSAVLFIGRHGEPSVASLKGEHDASNVAELSRILAQAVAGGTGPVVVDMSQVHFLSAASIGAVVGARNLLDSQSRALVVRSPSKRAERVLRICGLGSLIDPADAARAAHPAAGALATWVAVPQEPLSAATS